METTKQEEKNKEGFMAAIKKFFHEHPFVAWNIFTILAFFIHWSLALIFFFISLVFWNKRRQELAEQKRQQMVAEAESYIEKVKERKALPPITPSIFLEKNEQAFLEEQTSLKETRAVRKHSGGMSGVGFRVVKGVYIGGGRRSGTSESHQEWRTIDSGNLVITNQRLVFRGSKENRSIPLKKIISVDTMRDAIEVAAETRNKVMIFPVKNSYIWGAVINIVRRVDDPSNLGDVNLDIKFQ